MRDEHRTVPIGKGEPQLCVQVEPSDGAFAVAAIDPATVSLNSIGTGSITSIRPIPSKRLIPGDVDRNGIAELQICFAREDLARLFGYVRGRKTLAVSLEGRLVFGRQFRGVLNLTVVVSGRVYRASVTPNPINPVGDLSFITAAPGPVRIQLFDLGGRLVRTLLDVASAPAGPHRLLIDGRSESGESLGSGIYFYRISTPDGSFTGRLVVLK